MSYNGEQVLVFPAQKLDKHHRQLFQGGACGHTSVINDLFWKVIPSSSFFFDRAKAEVDPTFLQVIPYCVLQKDDGTYFSYQRTKKGGENRLHDKWSVGVGGHINPVDGETNGYHAFWNGLQRELKEELGLENYVSPTLEGLLYDPSNDVGKVHFGVVVLVRLPGGFNPDPRDDALANGVFLSRETLLSQLDYFENWSKLVISHLLPEGPSCPGPKPQSGS